MRYSSSTSPRKFLTVTLAVKSEVALRTERTDSKVDSSRLRRGETEKEGVTSPEVSVERVRPLLV